VQGKGEKALDDLQIIELYNARDESAISETDNKYGKYCYKIAYNILYDTLDSEECVNDTYLKTWNAIPPQRPNSLKLFLAKITRNLSLDRFKAKNRQKRCSQADIAIEELGDVLKAEGDAFSELEQKELAKAINRFLYSLKKRECNIFIRRYFYMATVEEISRGYLISEANVLVILSRTRKKLKEFLESEGYSI
jgi:RNA polymerase sigma-70 factor (ECF subfamily)